MAVSVVFFETDNISYKYISSAVLSRRVWPIFGDNLGCVLFLIHYA